MVTSTPFKSFYDVHKWLSRFINLESGHTQVIFGLERIKALAAMAGHPEKCAPSFHMAGSKGKGSVTGMIAAILGVSGKKITRYTSPHVYDFRERLFLGNGFFPEEIYVDAGKELLGLADNFILTNREEPSFFELLTLWFFLCSRKANCDIMVVETGLGGRLDATNILDPLVSVITPIELEHTEVLGNTIAAIAGEKAGIIKPGKPLVLSRQKPEALEVFQEHASRKKSQLFYFPDWAELKDVSVSKKGTSFSLVLKNPGKEGLITASFPDLFIPMPGEVQAENAGLAVLAIKTIFPDFSEEKIREGLAGFTLPARFERICDSPQVVIDGAHTGQSIKLCLNTFSSLYGDGGILIFGCGAEKNVQAMAELCVPRFSKIIITTPGTFKKSFPEKIYSIFEELGSKINERLELFFIPDTKEAVDKALSIAMATGLPILGAGSFYLASEIRSFIKPGGAGP